MNFTIFISYAGENENQARGIKQWLEALGAHVLWDNNLGVNEVPPLGRLDHPILRGIRQSDIVAVIVSRFANTAWVNWEIAQAEKLRKQVWPLAIERVAPPGGAKLTRYVDINNPAEVTRLKSHVQREVAQKEASEEVLKGLVVFGALAALVLSLVIWCLVKVENKSQLRGHA